MRLAGGGIEPIAQRHIESFGMHRPGPQRSAGLHRQQSSVPVALLDGLCQGNRIWDGPRRMPLFARQHQLSIGPQEHAAIALPAIAERGGNPCSALTLARSIEEVTGTKPRVEGADLACDGWMFSTRGIETICGYGVECGGVYGADEWVGLQAYRESPRCTLVLFSATWGKPTNTAGYHLLP